VVTVLHISYKNEGSVAFMEIVSVKVIHSLCVLFKCYTNKHNLNTTFKFSGLLVLVLLTSHNQTFFFF